MPCLASSFKYGLARRESGISLNNVPRFNSKARVQCVSSIICINAYKQRFAIISNHSTTVSCSWIFIQSALSIYYPSIQYAHLVGKGISTWPYLEKRKRDVFVFYLDLQLIYISGERWTQIYKLRRKYCFKTISRARLFIFTWNNVNEHAMEINLARVIYYVVEDSVSMQQCFVETSWNIKRLLDALWLRCVLLINSVKLFARACCWCWNMHTNTRLTYLVD